MGSWRSIVRVPLTEGFCRSPSTGTLARSLGDPEIGSDLGERTWLDHATLDGTTPELCWVLPAYGRLAGACAPNTRAP